MKPAVFRLVLTSGLFVAWMGYLVYLVATRPVTAAGTPLVVSRPQILTSQIDIIAEITAPDQPVKVIEVLWPKSEAPIKAGDELKVARISDCHSLGQPEKPDWTAQIVRYLVPLRPSPIEKGTYEVAPIPPSPGFHAGIEPPVRIYPATPEALAQYRSIDKLER